MKPINVRITDEEFKKIKNSGMTVSEYVRRAIDIYDRSREDIERNATIVFIEKCKEFLYKEESFVKNVKKSYYNDNENVKKRITEPPIQGGNVKNIFTETQKKQENVLQENNDIFTNLMKNTENVIQNDPKNTTIITDPITPKLGSFLYTLQKCIYREEQEIPISKDTINHIAKSCGLSNTVLERYIFEHKPEFREFGDDTTALQEHVKNNL